MAVRQVIIKYLSSINAWAPWRRPSFNNRHCINSNVGGNTFWTMTETSTIFEQKNHPTIKLFADKISIKAIDLSTFRDFTFDKIKELKICRPYDNSILGLLYSLHPIWKKYRETDNYVLRIKLKDGEHWDYETTSNFDQKFVDIVKIVQSQLTLKA